MTAQPLDTNTTMANQTLSYLLEQSPIKSLSITISTVLIGITSPLLYAIIWFERFGNDAKRTLLNQVSLG